MVLLNQLAPVGVINQIRDEVFAKAVTQKIKRKGCFLDLWRNFCWAIIAPGHPPKSARRCNVFSGVRQLACFAADLSLAYVK